MKLTTNDIKYIQEFQTFTQRILDNIKATNQCHDFTEGFFVRLLALLDIFQTEFWNENQM